MSLLYKAAAVAGTDLSDWTADGAPKGGELIGAGAVRPG